MIKFWDIDQGDDEPFFVSQLDRGAIVPNIGDHIRLRGLRWYVNNRTFKFDVDGSYHIWLFMTRVQIE